MCSVKVESYAGGILPESIPEGSPRCQLRSQSEIINKLIYHDETTVKKNPYQIGHHPG